VPQFFGSNIDKDVVNVKASNARPMSVGHVVLLAEDLCRLRQEELAVRGRLNPIVSYKRASEDRLVQWMCNGGKEAVAVGGIVLTLKKRRMVYPDTAEVNSKLEEAGFTFTEVLKIRSIFKQSCRMMYDLNVTGTSTTDIAAATVYETE
jgi:hypothetical protein